MIGRLGGWEIGLIVLIILIVFGVGKLPQVGGAIGKGIRSFRKGQSGELDDDKAGEEDEDEEEEEEEKPKAKSKTAIKKKTATKKKTKKSSSK